MLVNNTKPTMIHVNGKTLKPGVNSVDVAFWKKVRKHKTIAKFIDEGTLVEETELPEDEEILNDEKALQEEGIGNAYSEEDYAYLSECKVPQARNVVAETFDPQLLNEWMKRETRNQVKGAIKKQLEVLAEETQERDRSQARQIVTGRGPEIVELQARPSAIDD